MSKALSELGYKVLLIDCDANLGNTAIRLGLPINNSFYSLISATKSFEAEPGSIRGDFGLGFTENIIHASDSTESFDKEVSVVFK